MANLTQIGRASLAKAISDKQDTLFLAWGTGAAGWDTTPEAVPENAEALVAEVGRARLLAAAYVVPDAGGLISTTSGTYTAVASPTTYLYLKFDFGFDFPAGLSIREVGLFIDAVVDPELLLGQKYIPVGSVVTAGGLLAAERFTVFTSDPVVGQVFQFILPF